MKKIGLFLFGICFALQMVAQEQNIISRLPDLLMNSQVK